MNWTCKKCGKTMDISLEQLSDTGGVVVCPQCLGTDTIATPPLRQPKPSRPTPVDDTPQQPIAAAVPPPVRRTVRTQQQPPARRPQPQSAPRQQQPRQARPAAAQQGKKINFTSKGEKKKSRGLLRPHSPWGCLWRSVFYTAILLAVYLFMGFFSSL